MISRLSVILSFSFFCLTTTLYKICNKYVTLQLSPCPAQKDVHLELMNLLHLEFNFP